MAISAELDLAFSAAEELNPAILAAAGPWADPLTADARWQVLLAGWLGDLVAELPASLRAEAYSLGLSLVDDATIANLNAAWRGHAQATDVLSFAAQDSGDDDAPAMPLPPEAEDGCDAGLDALELGDIVISLDTAVAQAAEQGHSLERELLFLASHGLLHLLGWDHPDDASLAAMLARQESLIQRCQALRSGPTATGAAVKSL